MKTLLSLALGTALPLAALAVYAPIPVQEQMAPVTITVETGLGWDSNILGTAFNEIDSWYASVSPEVKWDGSVSDQTLVTASYKLDSTYQADRPSKKYQHNHHLDAGVDHTFSPSLFLNSKISFDAIDSPEANTVALSDQSYRRLLLTAKLSGDASENFGGTISTRYVDYAYDENFVADLLDRREWQISSEGLYHLNEEYSLVGELRYRDIGYSTSGNLRDSRSIFYLAGLNAKLNEQFEAAIRIGGESRDRERSVAGVEDDYLFFRTTVVYRYAEMSYLSGGIAYQVNETDNPNLYVNEEVYRAFFNLQQGFTDQFYGSASLSWDTADIIRVAGGSLQEDRVTFGIGLTYLPNENWAVITRFDAQETTSDDGFRQLERQRLSISARYTFGAGN